MKILKNRPTAGSRVALAPTPRGPAVKGTTSWLDIPQEKGKERKKAQGRPGKYDERADRTLQAVAPKGKLDKHLSSYKNETSTRALTKMKRALTKSPSRNWKTSPRPENCRRNRVSQSLEH